MNSSNRPILSDTDRQRILDELDRADIERSTNRRKWARLEYRLRGVPVRIDHPNGSTATVLAPTRNISCGGMSLLMTSFLHVGTAVTVGLPDLKGGHKACAGKVAFCRFIGGKVHEVGVSFTEVIDTNEFCVLDPERSGQGEGRCSETRAPLAGSVIVLSHRSAERVLAVGRLRQTGLDATGVETPGGFIDRLKRSGASAVVLDMSLDQFEMDTAMGALQDHCPSLPLVGLVYPSDPAVVTAALGHGMAACIVAPLAVPEVHDAMARALGAGCPYEPSDGAPGQGPRDEHDDDPDMVRYFVSHCAECVVLLETATKSNDVRAAQAVCRGLQATAPGYGFRSVAFAAREALAELNATGSIEESTGKLVSLLNVLNRLASGMMKQSPEASANETSTSPKESLA